MWKVTDRSGTIHDSVVFDEDSSGFRPIADVYLASMAEQIAADHNNAQDYRAKIAELQAKLAAVTAQRDAAVEACGLAYRALSIAANPDRRKSDITRARNGAMELLRSIVFAKAEAQ